MASTMKEQYFEQHKTHDSVEENANGVQKHASDHNEKIPTSSVEECNTGQVEMNPNQMEGKLDSLHADEPSLGLLNGSFDTLSDAGASIMMSSEMLTPPKQSQRHRFESEAINLNNSALSFAKCQTDDSNSDISVGDISPIKLVYLNSSSTIRGHHQSQSQTAFSPSPYARDQRNASVIPSDWQQGQMNAVTHRSNPFFVIRSSRRVFEKLKYLLPCVRAITQCQVNMSEYGSIRHYQPKGVGDTEISSDLKIAIRRVEAAICAFGGTIVRSSQSTSIIFRQKNTPSEAKESYDKSLPGRYSVTTSAVTWDVEEEPPVKIQHTDPNIPQQPEETPEAKATENLNRVPSPSGSTTSQPTDKSTKMKYKCKLCGQLKQNHNCPYQYPLQRSIGVMVYPAVNSYTAAEPGTVAPALTKMNNFVSYDSDHGSPQPQYPVLGVIGAPHDSHKAKFPSTITPDSLRGGTLYHSPQSSLSVQSSEDNMAGAKTDAAIGQKRTHSLMVSEGSTHRQNFVESVSLRPEHYRAVTAATDFGEYKYKAIPLTFAERKRLSDTLFFLSREIPNMTSDCASILRDARKKNEWDIAIAELLTQIVVGLYCGEGDARLDGLQRYLLALGISC